MPLDANIRPIEKGLIAGSDIAHRAVKSASTNCHRLPGGDGIHIKRKDFQHITELKNHVILCNPPYGLRVNSEQELGAFYKALGNFLKRRCTGSEGYLYFGNREMIIKIGLKPAWKKPIRNAALDGLMVKYALH